MPEMTMEEFQQWMDYMKKNATPILEWKEGDPVSLDVKMKKLLADEFSKDTE